jgi:hypothetical protein
VCLQLSASPPDRRESDNTVKISDEMRAALASYTGKVTICDAGKPHGRAIKKHPTRTESWLKDPSRNQKIERRTKSWLAVHANDTPARNPEAERRQRRMERARRERIEKRNAAIRKRTGVK